MKAPILVYIAGPYRGVTKRDVARNIKAARRVAAEIWAAGHAAICPHMNSAHFDDVAPAELFLAGTLEMLRRCDAVLMLPGWSESEGACAERAEALRLGMPVAYYGEADTAELIHLASTLGTVIGVEGDKP